MPFRAAFHGNKATLGSTRATAGFVDRITEGWRCEAEGGSHSGHGDGGVSTSKPERPDGPKHCRSSLRDKLFRGGCCVTSLHLAILGMEGAERSIWRGWEKGQKNKQTKKQKIVLFKPLIFSEGSGNSQCFSNPSGALSHRIFKSGLYFAYISVQIVLCCK